MQVDLLARLATKSQENTHAYRVSVGTSVTGELVGKRKLVRAHADLQGYIYAKCRKTKTNVITATCEINVKFIREHMRTQIKKRPSLDWFLVFGFGLAYDWMRSWSERSI